MIHAQNLAIDEDGRVLALRTPGAGTETRHRPTPGRGYTPKHLADKILASRSVMEGEKKKVSVLFCDIADSMILAEKLGPEQWHALLDEVFAALTGAVHRHEGTVNQYTGDGVMALFGAPIAAEDHARRACMAALEIQQALRGLQTRMQNQRGLELAARVGINSGEVVVGRIGDDLRMDYTAQGQVVGIASRLQSLAAPGGILLSTHTARQVRGFFELHSRGPTQVKGVSKPLGVFELGAAKTGRTRLDIARARGFSLFVGRNAEMTMLMQALKRSDAGHGQVVSLAAPPGTGKSRLCWEFAQHCRQQGIQVLRTQGLSHAHMQPYQAVFSLTRGFYGYDADDPPEVVRKKVSEVVLGLSPNAAPALPALYEFLGVPDPRLPPVQIAAENLRRQYQDFTRWVFTKMGRKRCMVIIFEDLQWFDTPSLDWAEIFSRAASETRTLIVMTSRPDFRADWLQDNPHIHHFPLQPLDNDALAEMLAATLGNDGSLQDLCARIIQTSGGNPFFVEEILQSLIEEGALSGLRGAYRLARPVEGLPLPDSVHDVLAARIDRLQEQDKLLLESAAVIGREFDSSMLEAMSGQPAHNLGSSLERLQRAEFIHPVSTPTRFTFKHALTQEVVYRSLLQKKRGQLHRQVAELLEKRPDGNGMGLRRIAHHHEMAGDLCKAALAMDEAARAAAKRDLMESLRLRREYLRLEQMQPWHSDLARAAVTARRALIEWSGLKPVDSGQAAELFEQGCAIAREGSDNLGLCQLQAAYALRLQSEARHHEALALIDKTLQTANRHGEPVLEAAVHGVTASSIYSMAGLVKPALDSAETALRLAEQYAGLRVAGLDLENYARYTKALMVAIGGRLQQGMHELQQLIDSQGHDRHLSIFFADDWMNWLRYYAGITEGAKDTNAWLEKMCGMELGPLRIGSAHHFLGIGHCNLGDWESARRSFESALALNEHDGGLRFQSRATQVWYAWTLFHFEDRRQEALTRLMDLCAPVHDSGTLLLSAQLDGFLSRMLRLARGEGVELQLGAVLERWQACIDESGMELFRHLWWWEKAALARLQEDHAGYHAALNRALASAGQCGARGHAELIRRQLAAAA